MGEENDETSLTILPTHKIKNILFNNEISSNNITDQCRKNVNKEN